MLNTLAVVLLVATSSVSEGTKAPARFQWVKGHVFTYRVEQFTQVVQTEGSRVNRMSNQLQLTKVWKVIDVDGRGNATVQLSLKTMRLENKTPDGETLVFDSEKLEKSEPGLKKQLSSYVGKPLAVLRVSNVGRVLAVKESHFGPASRFQTELPFVCELATEAIAVGSKWTRDYNIVLEPPQGTGEKFGAVQSYTCKTFAQGVAEITVTTQVKDLPKAMRDQIPLLQAKPKGTVRFDVKNGRFVGAQLNVHEELKSGKGEDLQTYQFQSTYREKLVSHVASEQKK